MRNKLLNSAVLFIAVVSAGCSLNASNEAPGQTAGKRATPTPRSSQDSDADSSLRDMPAGREDSNLLFGNPSEAGREPNNYLVERPQHVMSYNKSNGGPNWVSWHLDKSDLGDIRRGTFRPDPLLPPDMQIRPSDYKNSGYDRGHVCPSGDRTRTKEDNTATFVMSNMLPQAAALNQQVWKDLEDYSRYLVGRGDELYVVAGGSGSAERIGNNKVNVPAVCWKIIVVLPEGNGDLRRINANTRVIAVSMPNREREEIADSKWAQWTTSVDQLEKTTGYDFLAALPDSIENALEKQVDSGRAERS
ncbi:MAG TPA: DNA/RNA non-specific endonuclease [Abditibacteriaceae bacterium]